MPRRPLLLWSRPRTALDLMSTFLRLNNNLRVSNQHLAVEGDKVAAPIPIPTLSREYICLCLCLPNHHVGGIFPVAWPRSDVDVFHSQP